MNLLKLSLVFCITSSFAMEEPTTDFALDQKGVQEFRAAKQRLVELGKNVENCDKNSLFNHYMNLAQQDDNQLRSSFDECHFAIKQLYDFACNNSEVKKKFSDALSLNTDMAWNDWRKTRGCLMRKILEEKGIVFAAPSSQYIAANAHLKPEALKFITASSFLLYHARQIQREKTGKDLPPLILN